MKMKKTIGKITGLLLAAIMLMSCLPIMATAYNLPFEDVPQDAWYRNAVEFCYFEHYMNGTSDTTFAPNAQFTREMFVTVLAAIDKADTSAYTEPTFDDVAAGQWYTAPIEWAAANNFTAGKGNGKFGVGETVTREQVAQFLYNYAKIREIDVTVSAELGEYVDAAEVDAWAAQGMSWAVGAGLISGKEGSRLDPRGTATRAEVAVMIMRFCEYVESVTPEPKDYILTFDANGGLLDGEASLSFGANFGDKYSEITGWDEIHEPVMEGYVFTGWYYQGWFKLDNLDEVFSLHEDGTLVAGWDEAPEPEPQKAYKLTFDANGGLLDGETSLTFPIDKGDTYGAATGWTEIHEPVLEGYVFVGWYYYSYKLDNLDEVYSLESDGTFTAIWEEEPLPKDYKITFDANGGTINGEASVEFGIDKGDTYAAATGWTEIAVPELEGYNFKGWYVEKYNYTLASLDEVFSVEEDIVFVAQWEEKKTPVSYYLDMTGHAFTNDPQYVGNTFTAKGIATGNILGYAVYEDNSEEQIISRGNKKYFRYFLEGNVEIIDGETVITEEMIGEHTVTVVSRDNENCTGTVTLTFAAAPAEG